MHVLLSIFIRFFHSLDFRDIHTHLTLHTYTKRKYQQHYYYYYLFIGCANTLSTNSNTLSLKLDNCVKMLTRAHLMMFIQQEMRICAKVVAPNPSVYSFRVRWWDE